MESTKIIIFSGTTEGRKLSEMLSKNGMKHIVCVASEYGSVVMDESMYADVRVGRLETDEMKELFAAACDTDSIIVDATHPYATIVTENIKNAANDCNLEYIRIIRNRSDMDGIIYDGMEQVKTAISDILSNTDENVLLTTGSKDIHLLCDDLVKEQKAKLYVRVLPSLESLNICREYGIEPSHIIAIQGPFSEEMNIAQIKHYNIRHLVTKESGSTGGFEEKIAAARKCNVTCHIIARKDETGVNVKEAYAKLADRFCFDISKENNNSYNVVDNDNNDTKLCKPKVVLAGRGMGTGSTLTYEVKNAINSADAVFGASRLVSDIVCDKKYEMYRAEDIIPVLQGDKTIRNAVVLFSGDSGFYSGASAMREKFKDVAEVQIMCGISSVSYFASKLETDYQDSCIRSLHGRNDAMNMKSVVNDILHNRKTFVLLSGSEDVRNVACEIEKVYLEKEGISETLLKAGVHIYIGTNLSYVDEKIDRFEIAEAKAFDSQGVMLGFIDNELYMKTPVLNMLRDDQFIRDKVPMTKEWIRHESIIELNLKKGDVVYDIGGGTGSVAIEIAKQDPGIKVYTIEKKTEAVELIKKNIEKLGVTGVTVIEGEAPDALENIEACDAVFVGGSSGKIEEILAAVSKKKSDVRVVINAVSMETIYEVGRVLKNISAKDIRMVQLSATEIKEVGDYHMMHANNPVMIYSFTM